MKNTLLVTTLILVLPAALLAQEHQPQNHPAALSAAMHHAAPRHGPSRPPGRPGGHFSDGRGGWTEHPGWHGDIHQFNHEHWRGGHWWHGGYEGRNGWWWIVGPDWYWYSEPIYPYPSAYVPPGMTDGYMYWCEEYQDYYPNVGACPSEWQKEPAE